MTGVVFGCGIILWIWQLITTLVLVKAQATWYPGTIHTWGGEYDGWLGPGWVVGRTWCFGTQEMCANSFPTPYFTFYPLLMFVCLIVWGILSIIIGRIVMAIRRRKAKRQEEH